MKRRIIAAVLAFCILLVCASVPTTAAGDSIGKYAVPNPDVTEIYVWDREIDLQSPFYHEDFADGTVFYVENYYQDSQGTGWYLVSFYTGSVVGDFADAWPAEPWVRADGLKFIDLCTCCEHCTGAEGCECGCENCDFCEKEEENTCACCDSCTGDEGCECGCGECDFCEKEEENTCACCEACTEAEGCKCECGQCKFCEVILEQDSISASVDGQTVTVTGALPEGATLEVKPIENEAAIKAELGMDGGFLWDIKVFDADGNEWQPAAGETVELTLPITGAPDDSTVNIIHVLDSVDAIKAGVAAGTVSIDDVSHLNGVFQREMAACQQATGSSGCIAAEDFDRPVNRNLVSVGVESFSVYVWNGKFDSNTSGNSGSQRIVFNPTYSHDGSNGSTRYVDSYVTNTSTIYCNSGGKWTASINWYLSYDGKNYQQVTDHTCISDASRRLNALAATQADIDFYVNTHEQIYNTYGSVVWIKCKVNSNQESIVKFIVVSDRYLTYDPNGVTCTLPSNNESKWTSTYWGSPISDKVGSDAHVSPASVTVGAPSNIQGNYHFLYWENTDTHTAQKTFYAGDTYQTSLAGGGLSLRAKWAQYYKVTLDAQNGSGDSDGTTQYWYLYNTTKVVNGETIYYWTNQACTQPLYGYKITVPTKAGHIFGGYWTGKNGTGTQYVDKNGVCINNLYSAKAADSTLYAYWIPLNMVSYQYTGTVPSGAPAVPAAKEYVYNTADIAVAAAPSALTGYTFSGWTTSDVTVTNGKFTMPNKAVTFTGSWVAKTFAIEYHANGGTGTMANSSATFGQNVKISDNGFTAPTGKKFAGWTTNATGENDGYGWFKVVNGNPVGWEGKWNWDNRQYGIASNKLVLYAMWENESYLVSYQYTGTIPNGAPQLPEAKKYVYNSSVSVEAAPTMTGYTLSPWETADAVVNNGSFTMPGNAVTLSADWIVNTDAWYVVNYCWKDQDGNDHQIAESKRVENLEFGKEHTVSADELAGYHPVGNETQTVVAGYENNEITFYYNAEYSITLNYNEGHKKGEPSTTTGVLNVVFGMDDNNTVADTDPVREGYDFAGWYTYPTDGKQVYDPQGRCVQGDNTYWDSNNNWCYADDLTLYAHWDVKTYTVNVIADSGVVLEESYPQTVEYGKKITILFAPEAGYEIVSVDVDGQSYGTTIELGILKLEIKKDTTVTITSVCTLGDLTIQKTGDNIDSDQVFLFEVTGGNLKLQVSVKGTDSVTIYQLKAGTYTVTEITTWSWRYTPNQQSQTVTISGGDITTVTFNNSRTNNDWLSAFYNIINAKGS